MTDLRDMLRRHVFARGGDGVTGIGIAASVVWLAVIAIAAWLGPEDQSSGVGSWLIWLMGAVLPLGLIWCAVWLAQALVLLRHEADALRDTLVLMRADEGGDGLPPAASAPHLAMARPASNRRAVTAPARPAGAEAVQAQLAFDAPAAPELTPTELYFALNFPDGPDDHEAIRCSRLALADPGLGRLMRAAQDVVTLLAGQGIYMDDLRVPETDPHLWRRFAEGARGAPVAALAVIDDQAVLDSAASLMRRDEVFRDVAQHFLRHFDKLLSRRAETDDPNVLAVLAETRSGRAFILLAQVVGMLGQPPVEASAQAGPQG